MVKNNKTRKVLRTAEELDRAIIDVFVFVVVAIIVSVVLTLMIIHYVH